MSAQVLTDNHLTLSILRKGKEALSLGYETHPTLSRLITGSDDIQIDSVKEVAKLKRDHPSYYFGVPVRKYMSQELALIVSLALVAITLG